MFVACAWSGLLFAEKTPNVGRLFFLNEFCYDSVHSQKNGERVCNHNSTEAVQKEQKNLWTYFISNTSNIMAVIITVRQYTDTPKHWNLSTVIIWQEGCSHNKRLACLNSGFSTFLTESDTHSSALLRFPPKPVTMLSGYKQMAQYLHDFSITSTKFLCTLWLSWSSLT